MVEFFSDISLFEFTILLAIVLGIAITIEMVTLLIHKIIERKNNKKGFKNMK